MDTIKQAIDKARYLGKRRLKIERLRRQGVPLEAIGKAFGISKQRVWKILRS
jgi:biotin operon repressor